MRLIIVCAAATLFCGVMSAPVRAVTTTYFDAGQVAVQVGSGVTSDTVSACGYLFTYTRDKLFTGGTGQPIGRPVRVPWPQGVEAQAVTALPPGQTDSHARLTIQRVDGHVFDFTSFAFQLLANTGGAGASIEIMPLLNGEDGLPNPVALDATGYYGMHFAYGPGSTTLLRGFDRYDVSLYVDFAVIELALDHAAVPGDFNGDGLANLIDFASMADCLDGPNAPPTATPPACEVQCLNAFDFDGDADVDLADFAAFTAWYFAP